jgi:hypothetical protein
MNTQNLARGGFKLAWNNTTKLLSLFRNYAATYIEALRISVADAAVNFLKLTASTTTAPVTLEPVGTDTNIQLLLKGKGTGGVKLATTSATITDAGVATFAGVVGPVTGNVTGNCSGSSGSCTGNAATATTAAAVALGAAAAVTFGTSALTRNGNNLVVTLPTVDPVVAGALWVDGTAIKVSAGA